MQTYILASFLLSLLTKGAQAKPEPLIFSFDEPPTFRPINNTNVTGLEITYTSMDENTKRDFIEIWLYRYEKKTTRALALPDGVGDLVVFVTDLDPCQNHFNLNVKKIHNHLNYPDENSEFFKYNHIDYCEDGAIKKPPAVWKFLEDNLAVFTGGFLILVLFIANIVVFIMIFYKRKEASKALPPTAYEYY